MIDTLFVDGNPRETGRNDRLAHPIEIGLDVERNDVQTGFHDLHHFGMNEIHDLGQHPLLLGALSGGHLDRIRQFVDRNVLPLPRHAPVDITARTNQQERNRPEQRLEQQQRYGHHPRDTHRMVRCEDFRHDLSEQQQQERNDHHLHDELQPRGAGEPDQRVDQSVGQDHDADIDQVIDDQNRRQQILVRRQQPQDRIAPTIRTVLQPDDIPRRKGEKSGFRSRNRRRNAQQQNYDQQDHGILQRKRVERHGLDKTRCQNYRYLAGPIHNRNGLVKQRTALPLVALLCGIVFQHDPRTAVTFPPKCL